MADPGCSADAALMPHNEEDDTDLFRRAAGKVRRLESDRVSHQHRPPRPVPRSVKADGPETPASRADPDIGSPAAGALLYCRPGVQRRVMRRLRRGQIRADDSLDLHGMRVHQAANAMDTFLSECMDQGFRCVRIIHGKGFGSGGGRSVLKENVARWLELREEVVAFSSAPPADGGTGAVYVLLRR